MAFDDMKGIARMVIGFYSHSLNCCALRNHLFTQRRNTRREIKSYSMTARGCPVSKTRLRILVALVLLGISESCGTAARRAVRSGLVDIDISCHLGICPSRVLLESVNVSTQGIRPD